MGVNKALLALFLCASLLFCGGCWDYQELNSLSIVAGMALDASPQGEWLLTAELANLQAKQDGVTAQILEGKGASISAAGVQAAGQTGRKLYFGHAQSVVVSRQLAAQGIVPVLDYISRQNDTPLSLRLMVSRQDTAGQVLRTKPSTEQLGSFELSLQAENRGKTGPDMPFYQFYSEIKEKGIDPFLPAVTTVGEGEQAATRLEGAALFRGTQLAGFLENPQTQILLMLREMGEGTLLEIQQPAADGGDVTLLLDTCKVSWKPSIDEKDQVICKIELRMECMVTEMNGDQRLLPQSQRDKLAELASAQVEQRVLQLLSQLQSKYQCDSIGLGLMLQRWQPQKWEALAQDWPQHFARAQFQVSARTTITGSGRMYLPVTAEVQGE